VNMKSRKIVVLVLTLLMIVSISAGCSIGGGGDTAQKSKLQKVLDRGHLIVGTGSTNVPWHFKDKDGKLAGFDIEMGRIVANAIFGDPTKVEFVEQSPDARIPNLLTDKVDITFQFMTISPKRLQQVAFSVPYYTEGIGLILPTGGKYKNYQEMEEAKKSGKDITIAILQNVDAASTVQEMLKGAKDNQYENQGLVYQAINSGRADAAAVDLSSIMWLASKESDKYLNSGFSTHPQNYGAAMRPNDQIWINFVNGVLLDTMTGATYQLYNDAYVKFFGEKLPEPVIGKPSIFR
jgi:polar amino acid transport system substrate-binding protein